MSDFIFHGKLADLDPDVFELTQLESERQNRKLILIPSESMAPMAVREALGSAFHNIYAEGVKKRTILMDLRILLKTVRVVIWGHGAY